VAQTKRAVCQSIVDLAHSVGAIACGGITSLEQLQALVAIGCDCAQGPFFGKPQPIDAFKTGLRPIKTETHPVQGAGDIYEWQDDSAA
jgi:EAL domain-containing protein (putative c-di-GMP-specific phosphodiesterase class I)